MLFVLSGPWGVGKSESIKYLSDNYGFMTLIPWSTKISSDYLRGTKYNLLLNRNNGYKEYTQNELKDLDNCFVCQYLRENEQDDTAKLSKEVGFWCQPFKNANNYQVLGYRMSEIMDVSNQNAVVIEADTDVAKQLKLASERGVIGRVVNIFLNYETEECFKERLKNEKSYMEYDRKLKKVHREKEIAFYRENTNVFDYCINGNSLEDVVQGIVNITLNFIRETPNMLHKKSGILGQRDIQLSLRAKDIEISINHRYQDSINRYLKDTVYKNGELEFTSVKSSSVDLYLSPECKVLRNIAGNQIDLVLGEETELIKLLKNNHLTGNIDTNKSENLDRVFQLVNDSRTHTFKNLFQDYEMSLQDGVVLNPQDVLLCASLEEIKISGNIFAFITSKYSFSQIGLSVTLNQNILQPCHRGKVMLQLKNNLPYSIVIYPYMQIAQCIFFRAVSDSVVCSLPHDDFSSPRYDTSNAFKELEKEIIKSKNWNELNRQKLEQERVAENQMTKQEKRMGRQFVLAVIAIIISFLSLIGNILIKILMP